MRTSVSVRRRCHRQLTASILLRAYREKPLCLALLNVFPTPSSDLRPDAPTVAHAYEDQRQKTENAEEDGTEDNGRLSRPFPAAASG